HGCLAGLSRTDRSPAVLQRGVVRLQCGRVPEEGRRGSKAMSFKILSLDGGGIRGVFITACLARLERQLNRPLARYFDLIAGTSSGGFIAALLGFGYSAAEVHGYFKGYGPRIFERRTRRSPASSLVRRLVDPYLRRIGLEFEWLHGSRYKPDT